MQKAQHVVKHAEQVKTTASASWYWRFGLLSSMTRCLDGKDGTDRTMGLVCLIHMLANMAKQWSGTDWWK